TVSKINGETVIHEVKAPILGTVIGAFAKAKDKVDAVSSIYTIADLTKLLATFDVYEKNIADLKLAQKVMVYSVACPGKVFEGEITFISPRVDQDAYTIKARALIQNPENNLKLGMFINADIVIESDAKSIVLPQEAVHTINANKFVFVKTASDKFEAREVKIQDENKEEVALASGVSVGEEIVVQNGFLLKSELLKSKMGEGCAD
ncbi:MAG: efflux RND transporter periplasmic adaptor subunit, partial [Candidatus Omnitrophota bacterium]